MRDVVNLIAIRYSACFKVEINDEAKKVLITPNTNAVLVKSKHVETSEYKIENGDVFSLETNNETKTRYFCPFNLTGAPAWALRAFGEKTISK